MDTEPDTSGGSCPSPVAMGDTGGSGGRSGDVGSSCSGSSGDPPDLGACDDDELERCTCAEWERL